MKSKKRAAGIAKKSGCHLAPGFDIFSQLATILMSDCSREPVSGSDQVFAQAGNGVDFCFLEFFL